MRPPHSDFRSDSSGLFVRSALPRGANARGDIHSELSFERAINPPRQVILNSAGRVVQEGPSETGSFGNVDPTTSEADALGGPGKALVFGTTVSTEDVQASFGDFLRNFTKKYRMYHEGMSDEDIRNTPDANSKPYLEALETMLLLGTSRLFVDMNDLKIYPPTRKLWHQLILYPQEIVMLVDQTLKEHIFDLATKSDQASQPTSRGQMDLSQSSEPAFPSSDRPNSPAASRVPNTTLEEQVVGTNYIVRPFGMEKTINLRELNPSGKASRPKIQTCRWRQAD